MRCRNDPRFQAMLARAEPTGIQSARERAQHNRRIGRRDKSAPADKSIAVLAFANFGATRRRIFFRRHHGGVAQRAREGAGGCAWRRGRRRFIFKTRTCRSRDRAKANVAYVVEGSVQKSGTRVKITRSSSASDGFTCGRTRLRASEGRVRDAGRDRRLIAKNLQLTLGDARG